jgi:chromosomal replication initiation ATPase DnaA
MSKAEYGALEYLQDHYRQVRQRLRAPGHERRSIVTSPMREIPVREFEGIAGLPKIIKPETTIGKNRERYRQIRKTLLAMSPASQCIILRVLWRHNLTWAEVLGKTRKHNVVVARQEVCWRLYKERKLSLPRIGRLVGNRDHTTVLHSVRQHQSRLEA